MIQFVNQIGKKAIQGNVGIPSVTSTIPQKLVLSGDPLSLMRLYNGYAYACGSKIANFVSAVPVHLYAVVDTGMRKDLTIGHKSLKSWQTRGPFAVPAAQKALLRHRTGKEIVELTEHPLLNLIHRPNNDMSWPDFIQTVISYFSAIGNCYILPDRDSNGMITSLRPLLSEYMWLFTDGNGNITRYQYTPASQEFICHEYGPEDLIHLKTPSAGSLLGGRGWLEAVQKEVRLVDEFNDHMIALANNMGQPGAIITIKGKSGTEAEKETIIQKFIARFSRLKRGQPFVSYSSGPNDEVTVKPSGITPKDLAYAENLPWLRSTICAAAGVPEDLVHSTNSNRSSSQTAMASFLAYTIAPHLNSILEQINHRITHEYDNNVFFGYDPTEILRNDPVLQASVIKSYLLSGMITKNEAREMIDMAPVEGGDSLVESNPATTSLRGNERNMAGQG